MKRFRDESMEDYFDLLREFEMKKRSIDPNSNDLVTIRVPVALRDIYEDVTGENIKSALGKIGFEKELTWVGDKLRMKAHLARDMFSESIKNTISNVRAVLGNTDMENVTTLIMVGGYSECQLLQKAFRDAFNPDMDIVIPEEAGLAVLKGAVLFGHNPGIISSRILRYTYGCDTSEVFDPKIHPQSKRVDKYNPPRCGDLFKIYAKAGQSVEVGHSVSNSFIALSNDQTRIVSHIYTSTDPNPRFVTDPGCTKVGTYKIQLSPYKGKTRNYEETVVFGDTKIYVKGIEPVTGDIFDTTVNFLG